MEVDMKKKKLTPEKQAELVELAEAIYQIECIWCALDESEHPDIAEAASRLDTARCDLYEAAEAIAGEEIDVEVVTGRFQPLKAVGQ